MHLNNKELPFQEIGDYPSTYSSTNILCRLIEGLGYRYYWATASLNRSDLDYRPSDDSWTTLQIIEHIYGLSLALISTFHNKEFDFTQDSFNYHELREKTLCNFQFAHDKLIEDPKLNKLIIKLNMNGNHMTFPFWNHINGPISDAKWHCVQVVTREEPVGIQLTQK